MLERTEIPCARDFGPTDLVRLAEVFGGSARRCARELGAETVATRGPA